MYNNSCIHCCPKTSVSQAWCKNASSFLCLQAPHDYDTSASILISCLWVWSAALKYSSCECANVLLIWQAGLNEAAQQAQSEPFPLISPSIPRGWDSAVAKAFSEPGQPTVRMSTESSRWHRVYLRELKSRWGQHPSKIGKLLADALDHFQTVVSSSRIVQVNLYEMDCCNLRNSGKCKPPPPQFSVQFLGRFFEMASSSAPAIFCFWCSNNHPGLYLEPHLFEEPQLQKAIAA